MRRNILPTPELIQEALAVPERVRNVCVIAHVDHGKTSLCDHLVASNGYLSQRAAGQARYMDAREDEQSRLITIKSSSIPLLHTHNDTTCVINLIDSPGHIDFSVEVSAAARLCDGALLVVDVLEGFQSQSKMVMRQACKEGVSLLLVLNKMDRLHTEAKLTATEVYVHIRDILETVNATLQKCIQDEGLTDDIDEIQGIFEKRCFSPEKGNVVFVSALHGWAFNMTDFSSLLAKRILEKKEDGKKIDLDTLEKKLRGTFWGNYSINMKTYQITSKGNKKNIASTFVFDPISEVYSLIDSADVNKAKTIARRLEISVSESELNQCVKDPTLFPKVLMGKWLPCSRNILNAILLCLPNPLQALPKRMERFGRANYNDLHQWPPNGGPLVLYIAKSVSADTEALRLTGDKLHGREKLGDFVGFGRVFHGTLNVGDELHVPVDSETNTPPQAGIKVRGLYLPVGMDLLPVSVAHLGTVVAVSFGSNSEESMFEASLRSTAQWLLSMRSSQLSPASPPPTQLEGYNPVDRCVTLTDAPTKVKSFDSVYRKSAVGILRIGVGPESLNDWTEFLRGLALLYRADPAVHIEVLDSGEFILCCQGQVHAERVIQDLNYLYCSDIKLTVSPPLVSLREGLVRPPVYPTTIGQTSLTFLYPPWSTKQTKMETFVNKCEGVVKTSDVNMTIKAMPMPNELLSWMDDNVDQLHTLYHLRKTTHQKLNGTSLESTVSACAEHVSSVLEKCVAGGSNYTLQSICVANDSRTMFLVNLMEGEMDVESGEGDSIHYVPVKVQNDRRISNALVAGFESASKAGPMCEEPVRGVMFVLTKFAKVAEETVHSETVTTEDLLSEADTGRALSTTSAFSGIHLGTLIGSARNACRQAIQARGCNRIYELYLRLEIQCDESVLGRVHSLLSQKRAPILSEDFDSRTGDWTFVARIPSTETYDLAAELRRCASGRATVILTVEGWALNPQDPFPECSLSAEEEEDEGVNVQLATASNISRSLLMSVRKRKGLPLGTKIVESGDKQRTLGRSK